MKLILSSLLSLLFCISAFADVFTVFDIHNTYDWLGDGSGYFCSVNTEGAVFNLSTDKGDCSYDLVSPSSNSFSWKVYKGSSFSIDSSNVTMTEVTMYLDDFNDRLYVGEGLCSEGWTGSLDEEYCVYTFTCAGLNEFFFKASEKQIRIKKILVTGSITGNMSDQIIYENKFDDNLDGWNLKNDYTLSDFRGWKINTNYPKCAICSSFFAGENHPAHSIMEYTLNLEGYVDCRLSVSQAFGFDFPFVQDDHYRMYISWNDTLEYLDFASFPPEPESGNWSPSFALNEFDISEFDGDTVTVGFEYTTDGSQSRAWELKDFIVSGTRVGTSVSGWLIDFEDAKSEYFDMHGQRVASPSHGIYIVRQGSRTYKVVL